MGPEPMKYQILNWDTEFFGIKIAKITESNLDKLELENVLSDLKKEGVKLVYWAADKKYDYITKLFEGRLVDIKTTFAIDFESLNLNNDYSTIIEAYSSDMNTSELEDLAIQSGEHSRFAVDPNFKREKFVSLYKEWIKKSISGEIAKEVFVIRESNKIVGMITLDEKNGKGNIGLLAVDKSSRGKKYGENLVRATQLWFRENGYTIGQVVTQGKNIAACNFYKKCGYSVDKIEYFYHFWL